MSLLLNENKVRFDKMKLIDKGDSTLSHLASSPFLNLIQGWRLVVLVKKKMLIVHLVESKTRRGKKWCLYEKGKGGIKW